MSFLSAMQLNSHFPSSIYIQDLYIHWGLISAIHRLHGYWLASRRPLFLSTFLESPKSAVLMHGGTNEKGGETRMLPGLMLQCTYPLEWMNARPLVSKQARCLAHVWVAGHLVGQYNYQHCLHRKLLRQDENQPCRLYR